MDQSFSALKSKKINLLSTGGYDCRRLVSTSAFMKKISWPPGVLLERSAFPVTRSVIVFRSRSRRLCRLRVLDCIACVRLRRCRDRAPGSALWLLGSNDQVPKSPACCWLGHCNRLAVHRCGRPLCLFCLYPMPCVLRMAIALILTSFFSSG